MMPSVTQYAKRWGITEIEALRRMIRETEHYLQRMYDLSAELLHEELSNDKEPDC